MSLVAGATIGPYRILEQIGRGGMATVYKAYQASLARNVAIKVLPAFFAEDPSFRERFQQEAIAIAKLRHPNILAVFDYGEENGVTYIVSEYVDGGTLAEQLGKPLPVDYVVTTLLPIASALDYAHAQGVLHRDIKPSNILLARNSTPILSDFGLAKMVGSMPRLTATGTTVGTPEYMAPEQGSGEQLGPAADQYALAVVAYEMLTGRVPFTAETPLAVLLAHMHKPLPLPREVNPTLSAEVEAVLLKGLAKTPGERYPTITEFVATLADASRLAAPIASGAAAPVAAPRAVPTTAPAPGLRSRFRVRLRRRHRWVALGALALVLLLLGVAFLASREESEGPPLLAEVAIDQTDLEVRAPDAPASVANLTVTYSNNSEGTLTDIAVLIRGIPDMRIHGARPEEGSAGELVFRVGELAPWSHGIFEAGLSFTNAGTKTVHVTVRASRVPDARPDPVSIRVLQQRSGP